MRSAKATLASDGDQARYNVNLAGGEKDMTMPDERVYL